MNTTEKMTIASQEKNKKLLVLINKYYKELEDIDQRRKQAEANHDEGLETWMGGRNVQLESVQKDLIKLYIDEGGEIQ